MSKHSATHSTPFPHIKPTSVCQWKQNDFGMSSFSAKYLLPPLRFSLISSTATTRSTGPSCQTFSKPPPPSNSSINHPSNHLDGATIPRCLPRADLRSLDICHSLIPQNTISNPSNLDGEDRPEILPWSGRREGRQVRGLCDSFASPMHDPR